MMRRIAGAFRWALRSVREAGAAPGRGSRLFQAALILMVIAAAVMRLWRCHRGLPYVHTWDEPQAADSAIQILKTGDLNPHFFTYGSVTIYIYAFVDFLHYLFLMGQPDTAPAFLTHIDDLMTHHQMGWLWTVSHPTFYLWNRYVMAIAGAGAVLLTYWLGRKLGGRAAGFLGAALLGALAIHVSHSGLLTPDVMVSLLAAGTVLLAILFLEHEKPLYLILSLAVAGLTASTKYNAAIGVITPVAALAIAAATRNRGYRPWLWAAVPLVPAAFFLMGTPYALLDLKEFVRVAGREVRVYRVLGSVGNEVDRVEPGLTHMWVQFGYFVKNLGWPGTLLAILGLVVVASRKVGWLLLPFPILYFYFMIGSRVPFERNYMALYPFIAASFGVGAVLFYRWAREMAGERTWPSRAVAAVLVVGVALWLGQEWRAVAATSWRSVEQLETRTIAMREADSIALERAGDSARLGVAEELRIHPNDLRSLHTAYEVRPLADLLCERDRYTLLVTGDRYGSFLHEFDEVAALWNDLPLEGRFGEAGRIPGETLFVDILSTNPGVRILAPAPADPEMDPICGGSAGQEPEAMALASEHSSAGFFPPAGEHALVWRAEGDSRGWRLPKVRFRVEAVRGGDQRESLGELVADLTPREREFALRFTARDGDLVVLRITAVDATGRPIQGAEGWAQVGPVRLLNL